jgi:glycosyltransferase involved in cell wall biosynthesis
MIASTSFFSDYGNHVRIWEEARAIQARNHQVVLATYHNGDDIPGIDIRRSWDVPWIKRAVVGSSRHKLYLDIGLAWRSLRVALERKPDLIHAHTHEAASIGIALKRLLNVPLVLDYQGSMTSEMLDHNFIRAESRLFQPLVRLEQFINRSADAILTSTYNAARLLRETDTVDPKRIHTIIDSVNTERFRPFDGSPGWEAERVMLREQLGIPHDHQIVVFIGLLARYQGTHALIEAAQHVCSVMPKVHFLIMGHPDPASYRAYAASLGIADRVTLPGRIYYRDLHSYLALGDVAVAPKMSLTEGNGKISNYMAMGLPVVAFDTPVSREMLGETGIYVRFGDVDDLADKIQRTLQDRYLAQHHGVAGRARAIADFSWQQAAARIEAIYTDLINNQQAGSAKATPRKI